MSIADIGEAWDANKKVIVPLGSLATLFGLSVWLTMFYMTVQQMAADISEMKEAQRDYVTTEALEARFLIHNLRYHGDELSMGPKQ